MSKILIIEDEAAIRRVLTKILSEEDENYIISEAKDGEEGLEILKKEDFNLILCDIKMPKKDGMEVLLEAKEIKPESVIVMISGHGDLDTAVQAMKLGAFDYISKPPDLNRLLNTVRNALNIKTQSISTKSTEIKASKKKTSQSVQMIGESEAIRKIKAMIEKVSQTDARVLITGPNGTGKELVAHALHQNSERASAPMIEVNCAAIPSELIESELFGHVKGAFTSAIKDREGKFEAANKGTIFLDEIGDMSLSAQAKVLRALQENRITRVGSDKDIKVDVRVIAATNKDLKKEIAEGRFREDLYHRLAVILLQVPALNERRDDIPLLIQYFTETIAQEQNTAVKKFQPKAIKLLQQLNWTGNIRELRNVVERLIILGGKEISEDDVKIFAGKN
ncbi:sigma-54-dependent transcriptional regulator [Capnocytophaga catalasegens]|uniref:Fis family transcriptional regulator n=1 Tax=Capnocytophaga catalasegens TaxID=1004260 RepID=A0AAV5ATM8_9FLAO|nr:sigma-54 dependent transcriptional regulator [Capnocytophaga catalasegens]GIZ14526.1 Fis family transcriptional regulator [Capnocytophaga catalasegens]GJM50728.1 Fis family transcriptional regulator [Capnocytophaga catalasegens]GJM51881.1 Fis family transcriptional regulator [Capnocytophaga catalasegens]